jgi:DNA-binding transcriptional ArsR family regulator
MATRTRSSNPALSVRIKTGGGGAVFHAVSDPTRRALLDKLRGGESPMTTLADGFDMSLAAVSQHLKVLREAGLVAERREGRRRIYYLTALPLREVADWVSYYQEFWSRRLSRLGDHLRKTP